MMPNLLSTLMGFEETVGLTIVKKTVVDHQLAESSKVSVPLYFEGILEPLQAKKLLIKPEGERKWKWWALFAEIRLDVDDIVKDQQGLLFRVMSIQDWRQGGYYEYELREGPGV